MKGKALGSVVALIIAVTFASLLGLVVLPSTSYRGTDLTFTVGSDHTFSINGTGTMEAASSSFFAMRQLSEGVVAYGRPAAKPLGWKSDSYFRSDPTVVTGTWLVETGSNITVHIHSDSPVTVVYDAIDGSKAGSVILLTVLALAVWAFLTLMFIL